MRAAPAPWRPDLHLRLAQRHALDQRATRATAAALGSSVLAWVLGLDLGLHAAAMLATAAVAALLPVREGAEQAFDWIGQRAGLAYQTFVEHHGRPDPHGFLAAAEVQARLSVRGVPAPRSAAWWLPLVAAAVGIWLLAAFVGGLAPWSSTAGAPSATPPSAPTPPGIVAEPELERGGDDDLPEAPRDEAREPGATPQEPGAAAEAAADPVGEEGERQALERFVENLRERPAEPVERTPQAEGEGGPAGEGDDVQPAGALQERREEDADVAGALRPADAAEQRREPGLDTAPGDAADEGEGGEEGEPGAVGPGTEGGALGEEPNGDGEGDAGEGNDEAEGREAAVARDPAEGEEDALEAGEGEAAGVGPGLPDDTAPTELEAAGDPEALPGMVLPGEETPGGRVRLPGRDDGFVPEGVPVERYERAVEQAITDGTVPVPYQEIIRNYFR